MEDSFMEERTSSTCSQQIGTDCPAEPGDSGVTSLSCRENSSRRESKRAFPRLEFVRTWKGLWNMMAKTQAWNESTITYSESMKARRKTAGDG